MLKKADNNQIKSLILRYLIIILIAIPNLYLFYFILTPLTIYPIYFVLNLFTQVELIYPSILIKGHIVELISACIAGSAYYLLFILNLSIPSVKFKKRLRMILFAFSTLLAVNIFRIIFLTILFINDLTFFDFSHKIFWYFLSTIFVVLIWFSEVKIFKLKQIPVYSDLKNIYKNFS